MSTEVEGKKKGLNPLIAIGAAAVVAAASGGAAFFLSPAGADAAEVAKSDDEPKGGDDHSGGHGEASKKADSHGKPKASDGHGASSKKDSHKKSKKNAGKTGTVYVPIEPLIISLGPESTARRLKITIVIEGEAAYESELGSLVPKFRDILNTYLRAADARDFESPAAMSRVRAHIARRLKIVAPDGAISGVLVTDFILD